MTSDVHTATGQLGERIAAGLIAAFGAGVIIATTQIEFVFSSDPLGPRFFPYVLGGLLVVLGLLYLRSPGGGSAIPQRQILLRQGFLLLVTVLAVLSYPLVGFLPASVILIAIVARLFGASLLQAVLTGVIQAVLFWGLFGPLLGTHLPTGSLWGV